MLRDKKQFDLKEFEDNLNFITERIANKPKYSKYRLDVLLMKYTRGDSFENLTQHFERLIEFLLAYKHEKLEREIEIFKFTYLERDSYILLAFAIALPISEKTWHTLTHEILIPFGRDYITDRIIATRNSERKVADFETWDKTAPAHQKYFKLLGEALEAPPEDQPELVYKQLKKWRHKNWRGSVTHGSDPDFTPNPCYYGQFSYEVAAVVMAFNIDDTLFQEDIYYPKELVDYYRERTQTKI